MIKCIFKRYGKENAINKRALSIGLLLAGVALLSGCSILDMIFAGMTDDGKTTAAGAPVSGRMEFNLAATVWERNEYTGTSPYSGRVGTTFRSGAGVYNRDGRCFNAYIWDGGDFSNTAFMACLSEDEKTVQQFVASQTQANVWGGYTYVHFIRGVNVPFSHIEGNSRYYRVEGATARTVVTELEFKMWVPGTETGGSYENPLEWTTGGPAALTGRADDCIEIRLDYPNTATSPYD